MSDTWICCDSCGKWRRIKQALADTLDEETPWHCSDNPDPVYNSCDVPQELTDVEIDEQTKLPVMEEAPEEGGEDDGDAGEGSDGDGDGDGSTREVALRASKLRKRPPVWQLISQNIYMHRERKKLDEDDVMVCQCKPIWATDTETVGCGEHCLNRMLNIECVAKFCPCGERCTNRAFSSRAYASLEVRRAGAKGFGLFAAQDIKAGQFIVEYVGEVLEEEEYARRKEFYIATGQRHYYFMNVGNGEVIDAARRGGLGRFINHSCEPNCETQKWVVRGELAIGLFALEDVPAGTELTFDYNFERYGDKPMKCLCGSSACRGMIGGAQETAARLRDTIVAPEEAEPDPEPIMVTEKEADAAVAAILDRAVGLGWEKGFDAALQRRLEKLAASKGVAMPVAAAGGGGEGSDAEEEGDSDEEIAAAAAAAKAVSAAKARASGKKTRVPRVPRAREADPDWAEAPAPASAPRSRRTTTDSERPTPSRSTPLIPKRAGAVATPGSARGGAGAAAFIYKRRSEVDRRLDELVGASGRLKDSQERTVLRLLRLFNLCDIGPTVEKTAGSRAGGGGAGRSATATGTATATATRLEAGSNRLSEREEGEVSGQSGGSGGAGTAAAAATAAAAPRPAKDAGAVTARQKARIADMSLLLDAIVRSCSNPPTRKALLASGALNQLMMSVGRLGHDVRAFTPPYYVILRKILVTVEELQPSPETVYGVRTAHGTFADFVKALTTTNDYEIRNRAWALHKKWLPGAGGAGAGGRHAVMESSAASVRTPQSAGLGMGAGSPGGGGWDRSGGGGGGRGPGPSRFGREREPLPPRGEWERGRDYGGREPREGPPEWERERQRGGRSPDRKRSRWEGSEAERPAPWGYHGGPGGPPGPGGRAGLLPLPPPEDFPPPKHHRGMRSNGSGAHLADAGGYGGGWEPEPQQGGWGGPPPPADAWGGPPPPMCDGYGPPPSHFPRPHSAVFSEASRGSGGAGAGAPPPPPPPAGAAANGAPELSPMTDDEEGAANGPAPPPDAAPEATNGNAVEDDDDDDFVVRIDLPQAPSPAEELPAVPPAEPRGSEGSPAGDEAWEESWEAPGERFAAYVAYVVQKRVAKYEQGEHPVRLNRDEAARLFKEIYRDITDKEAAAYKERRRRGQPKPIERRKLESRIKDYVRDKVKRYWAGRGGA